MEKQNVTLSVPKDLLRRAKIMAIEQETSLSGLLTRVLTEIVEQQETYAAARSAQIALLDSAYDLGTRGRAGWDRESLHER